MEGRRAFAIMQEDVDEDLRRAVAAAEAQLAACEARLLEEQAARHAAEAQLSDAEERAAEAEEWAVDCGASREGERAALEAAMAQVRDPLPPAPCHSSYPGSPELEPPQPRKLSPLI